MATLTLPRLAGTRDAVRDLMAEQEVSTDLAGKTLVVLARELASGSPSFADELVKEALLVRDAGRLDLVGAPERFQNYLTAAAARRGVGEVVNCAARFDIVYLPSNGGTVPRKAVDPAKPGILTTEFWTMVVLAAIGVLTGLNVIGPGEAARLKAHVQDFAFLMTALVGIGYMVSRGLTKVGVANSRRPVVPRGDLYDGGSSGGTSSSPGYTPGGGGTHGVEAPDAEPHSGVSVIPPAKKTPVKRAHSRGRSGGEPTGIAHGAPGGAGGRTED